MTSAGTGCSQDESAGWHPLPASQKINGPSGQQEEPASSTRQPAARPSTKAAKETATNTVTPRPPASVAGKTARLPQAKITVLKPQAGKQASAQPSSIADFVLTERSGRTIRRADLLGRPWVACFIFTHCAGPCTDVSAKMYELQEWLKTNHLKNVRLVTITVDPQRDTPAVLRQYAKNFGADKDRWLFLTGKQSEIYKLIHDSFREMVYEVKGKDRKPGWEVAHSTNLVLVDERGRIVERFLARDPVSLAALRQRLRLWQRTGSFRKPTDQPTAAP